MPDPRTEAATNNARWCDVVVRALGGRTCWGDGHWATDRRSPAGYPDAVTLTPRIDPAAVLAGVLGGEGCSVKDSFADLDLVPEGFRVLFDATWIRHRAPAAAPTTTLQWQQVHEAVELAAWFRGHDLDVFVPALLGQPDLSFFHVPGTGAGFALLRTGRVAGVSNVVAGTAGPAVVWADLVAVAAQAYPGLDLVGYERDADLRAALSAGFTATGPLRVWLHS